MWSKNNSTSHSELQSNQLGYSGPSGLQKTYSNTEDLHILTRGSQEILTVKLCPIKLQTSSLFSRSLFFLHSTLFCLFLRCTKHFSYNLAFNWVNNILNHVKPSIGLHNMDIEHITVFLTLWSHYTLSKLIGFSYYSNTSLEIWNAEGWLRIWGTSSCAPTDQAALSFMFGKRGVKCQTRWSKGSLELTLCWSKDAKGCKQKIW